MLKNHFNVHNMAKIVKNDFRSIKVSHKLGIKIEVEREKLCWGLTMIKVIYLWLVKLTKILTYKNVTRTYLSDFGLQQYKVAHLGK